MTSNEVEFLTIVRDLMKQDPRNLLAIMEQLNECEAEDLRRKQERGLAVAEAEIVVAESHTAAVVGSETSAPLDGGLAVQQAEAILDEAWGAA